MTRSNLYRPFAGPITPTTLAALFADRTRSFGGYRMEGDGGDGGDDDGGDGGDDDPPANGKTYTPDEVKARVKARADELTRKHKRELEEAKADRDKDATGRVEAERDRAVQRAEAAVQKAAPRVAEALAQVAAITAGGKPNRAKAIVKQADLDGVVEFDGDDWTVDVDKLTTAIEAVLDEYEEWKAEDPGKGGDGDQGGDGGEEKPRRRASGTDLGGGPGGGTVELADFQRMTMQERVKLRDDNPGGYAKLVEQEIAARANPGRR